MAHSAVATLTIPNAGTASGALSAYWNDHPNSRAGEVGLAHANTVTILSPVAGSVEVRAVPGGTWMALRESGAAADIALIANKAVTFRAPSVADLRVVAGIAVGADTPVLVSLQERMD